MNNYVFENNDGALIVVRARDFNLAWDFVENLTEDKPFYHYEVDDEDLDQYDEVYEEFDIFDTIGRPSNPRTAPRVRYIDLI